MRASGGRQARDRRMLGLVIQVIEPCSALQPGEIAGARRPGAVREAPDHIQGVSEYRNAHWPLAPNITICVAEGAAARPGASSKQDGATSRSEGRELHDDV